MSPGPRRWGAGLACALVVARVAQPAPGASADGARLRGEAHSILAERRFRDPPVPRPLHGVLHALGEWLQPVFGLIGQVLLAILSVVPGGGSVLWPVLGGIVLLGAGLLARRVIRRRARGEIAAARRRRAVAAAADDPAELEHHADEAERDGDLDLALRLRFRAGLLRLDARRAIVLRPSLTTGEVTRRLASPAFAGLAGTFEEVAYGGRPATEAEVQAARVEWPRILKETVEA